MSRQIYWRLLVATTSACLSIACGNSEEHTGSEPDAAVDSGSQDPVDSGDPATDEDAGELVDGDSGDGTDSDAGPSLDAGDSTDDAGQIEDDIPDGPYVVKMVAPSVCTVDDGRFLNRCHFGPIDLVAPSAPTDGRFKTRVSQHRKGDCTTGFRFVAELSADGIDEYGYDLGLNDEVFLRRDDDAALAGLHVEERESLAGRAEYDITCRVWLEVEFNVPIEEP